MQEPPKGKEMRHPKKCVRCHKIAIGVETDGVDLYHNGEKMPLELVLAKWPCRFCDGFVLWKRVKGDVVVKHDRGQIYKR